MDYLQIILFFSICFGYVFLLGVILLKLSKKNESSKNFIRGNLILSVALSTVIIILFRLIGGFSSVITGITVQIASSFIYVNIFSPLVFSVEVKKANKKEEIIYQVCLSVVFIILYGILYLVFMNDLPLITS